MRDFLVISRQRMVKRIWEGLEELSREDGASDFVALILIMVIIIAVAAIFREQLTAAVQNVFGQLTEFIG